MGIFGVRTTIADWHDYLLLCVDAEDNHLGYRYLRIFIKNVSFALHYTPLLKVCYLVMRT